MSNQKTIPSYFSNDANVPLSLALWLATDEYRGSSAYNDISATMLLKSPRFIIGEKRLNFPEAFPEAMRPIQLTIEDAVEMGVLQELQVDIQERIASRMGTAIHDSIQHAWEDPNLRCKAMKALGYSDSVIERVQVNPEPSEMDSQTIPVYVEQVYRKEIEVDGHTFIISGQIDTVIDGGLHDTKTTSTFTYETGCKDKDYILQGSIYRWLASDVITEDYLTIDFIFKNWQKNRTFSDGYPANQVMSKHYKLMSVQETELFIRNKLKQVVKYWNLPLQTIPCCSKDQIFRLGSVFKYYKDGAEGAKKSTRNFDSYAEATHYKATKGKHKGEIVEHKGMAFTCKYCDPDYVESLRVESLSNSNDINIG